MGPPPPKVDPELLLLLELELKGELLVFELFEFELKGELLLLFEPELKGELLVVEDEENGLVEPVEVPDELDEFELLLLEREVPTLTHPPALPEAFVELPELLVELELFELLELFVEAYMEPPLLAIDAALVAPLRATAEAARGCPKSPSGGTCASPKWINFQSSLPVKGLT